MPHMKGKAEQLSIAVYHYWWEFNVCFGFSFSRSLWWLYICEQIQILLQKTIAVALYTEQGLTHHQPWLLFDLISTKSRVLPIFSAAEVSVKRAPNWCANVSPLSLGTSLSPVRSHLLPTTHNAGGKRIISGTYKQDSYQALSDSCPYFVSFYKSSLKNLTYLSIDLALQLCII